MDKKGVKTGSTNCATSTALTSDDFRSIPLLKRTNCINFSTAERGNETQVDWPRDSQHHKTRLGKGFILTSWRFTEVLTATVQLLRKCHVSRLPRAQFRSYGFSLLHLDVKNCIFLNQERRGNGRCLHHCFLNRTVWGTHLCFEGLFL